MAKQDERQERTKQLDLFSADEQIGNKPVSTNLLDVEEYWLKNLKHTPERYGIEKLADMQEETGWFERDFQKAFGELARKGLVNNLDGTPKRRSKFVHFDTNRSNGERLAKVKP